MPWSRSNVYVARPPSSYRYYSYPRRSYPYGYGAFGLGYFYYDPFAWNARPPLYYYGAGYFGRGLGYDTGEVRLDVEPKDAAVYVDGYYAGLVDDFDGTFQSLTLEAGTYRLEFVLPGYETLAVDVRVTPRQKITYRGDLLLTP